MNLWYENLNKSPLTPPNYVFGIAWSILYTLIIVSFITNNKYCLKCPLTYFFILQFVFNLMWTPVFFKLKQPILAIIVLLLTLTFTILYFIKSNTISKVLLSPYILWLLFAGYLNMYIIINN